MNNTAYQMTHETLEEISDDEWGLHVQDEHLGKAQLLGPRKIRVNSVAPGPIWTPQIPSTMPEDKVESFGSNTPLGHLGQPGELAPVYVLLASDEGSYISGARAAVRQ